MSDMTLREFSRVNAERARTWHKGGLDEWSAAEWGNALAGECGELCNVLKKVLRMDMGIQQLADQEGREYDNPGLRKELYSKAADEIADVYAYLDLVAARLELDLQSCVVRKFNFVSDREQLPQRFPETYIGGAHADDQPH